MAKKKDDLPNELKSSSDHIRDALASNGKMKPAEIVSFLDAKGIKVKVGLVNSVKAALKKKGMLKGKAKTTSNNGAMVALSALADVKRAADAVGGMERLIEVAK